MKASASETPRVQQVSRHESHSRRDDKRLLFDNVVAMLALQAASMLLPLLTVPYLTRVLGPARFGSVAFAQATVQYVIVLVDFGFNLSATRAVALCRADAREVSRLFSAVTTAKLLLAVAGGCALVAAGAASVRVRGDWPLFVSSYALVAGQVLFPVWLFQGLERMRVIALLAIAGRAIFTALVFAVVRTSDDYLFVPLLNAVGAAVVGAAGVWIAVSTFGVRFSAPRVGEVWRVSRESFGFFVSRASVSVYTSSNVFFLGATSAASAAGLYAAAERVYGAMQGVYSPATTALLPFMSRTRDRRVFVRMFAAAFTINTLACISMIALAPWIVSTAFGTAYAGAASTLTILSLAMIVTLPSFFLGYPLLAAFGHARTVNASTVFGSALHLIGLLALLVTARASPTAVATMVLVTECVVLAIRVGAVYRAGIFRSSRPATISRINECA